MKKSFLAATILGGLLGFGSSLASAADLPVKAPVIAAPLPTWAGFYVGANAGGEWGTSRTTLDVTSAGDFFGPGCFAPINTCFVNVVDVQRAGAQKLDLSGFTGGAQAGYNWQTGAMVYGVEGDFNYFHNAVSGVHTVTLFSGGPRTVTVGESASTDWLFTFRGRLGFLASPAWLVYGTGGLAVTNLHAAWTFNETAFNNSAGSAFSNTKAGWTIGGGVETQFSGGWRLGLEYLYVAFDSSTSTMPIVLPNGGGPTAQNFKQSADLSSNIVRVKLNYAFSAPVVAKY
jgi:outer membrane immunogenic protein